MGNREQQILDEIKLMAASLKRQLEMLEMKISQLQDMDSPVGELPQDQIEEVEVHEDVEMEVSFDIMDMDIAPEPEPISEPEQIYVPEELQEPEQLPELESLPEPALELEASPIQDDLPEPEPFTPSLSGVVEPQVEKHAPIAVIDAMAERQAWRTDMPGTPVRDIRSAISLNDRILFINYLFNEDPMAFQETLTALNSMPSFDEAVNFVVVKHPEWDLESDTVYRFMMALRRRLQ